MLIRNIMTDGITYLMAELGYETTVSEMKNRLLELTIIPIITQLLQN